ncbi:hypothetical protein CONCODRAFT_94198 [Conidiobolus coronatus NRRL 28638]|uniref:Fe2OG dioxygenase domain-containing protein n=1 Tax=Conidiobolus coronatus (strain ATCC 28846 / CBS 209.66 / NRRL 28638) TaxID=796925 RepID=A0A137P3D5_CONC2|nr:hypothetical protein CONCODRAFT_94198 [Conidiobolus coronatus NRRL 28638]|eukprot:KXN69546.1 hypothetical protein CONCODRAFT_94198 [Conidiobolus coronatus NRRL 28638]
MTTPKRPKIESNILDSLLNSSYRTDSNFFKLLKTHISHNEPFNGIFATEPFKHFILDDLFDRDFLIKVKAEINENVQYMLKSNDLYTFHQSGDLTGINLPLLNLLKSSLYSKEFVEFLGGLLNISLFQDKLDISISRYDKGDYLLCHDDHVTTSTTGRRVAFILYLVDEGWDESCGGELSLFDVKLPGMHPNNKIVKLVPKWNHLIFFEIGNYSYHQVEEVLSATKSRLSIVGWFHGPLPTKLPNIITYTPLDFKVIGDDISGELFLNKFINPAYLKAENLTQMQNRFVEESCIELDDFLLKDVYDQIVASLPSVNKRWSAFVGPAHLRRYKVLIPNIGSEVVQTQLDKLTCFIKSTLFRDYLAQLTSLIFTKLLLETRKFSADCYTMVVDDAIEPFGLDVILTLCEGGVIHYVADEETLLTLNGRPNCLQLVLRDEGTLRFLKKLPRDFEGCRVDLSMTALEL